MALLAIATSAAPQERRLQLLLGLALTLLQLEAAPPLAVVTCGTQAAGASTLPAAGAAHGGVWGLARVLRLEHSTMQVVCFDTSIGHMGEELLRCVGACSAETCLLYTSPSPRDS